MLSLTGAFLANACAVRPLAKFLPTSQQKAISSFLPSSVGPFVPSDAASAAVVKLDCERGLAEAKWAQFSL